MPNKKFRWSKVYESSEEELIDFLQRRGLESLRITADESSVKARQIMEHDFTVWCAEGSLVLKQDTATVSLQPGDAIPVSANVPYDLVAGISGYVCYITN
jgi:mannose-6-phosphate isomerase class I